MKKNLILSDAHEDSLQSAVLPRLPPLPSLVRYYDEFTERHYSIERLGVQSEIDLNYCGYVITLRFSTFSPALSTLLKHVFVDMNSRDMNANAMATRIASIRNLTEDQVAAIALSSPESIASVWTSLLGQNKLDTLVAVKEILKVLCTNRVGGWSPSYAEYISKSLALPTKDKYAFLRTGNAFLTVEQESTVVALIDDAVQSVNNTPQSWTISDLCDVAMLICAFQFGMRPTQIARVKRDGIRHRRSEADGTSSVHVAFPMIKQRRGARTPLLIRRVKPEWNSVFVEIMNRSASAPENLKFFDVSSGREVGSRITAVARSVLDDSIVSTKTFRHSAAQRMVDAGASHEELAAFLGHADITSGLFYFQASATHGEVINRALGISEIYSKLATVAHDRFISEDELLHLKGERQVGGVPHGIPITGIGGCTSGQPACPYNPVISCYGCRRFMPLQSPSVHRQVLANLRSVVGFFSESSRSEQSSPTYLQLQRTIANVQSIVGELEGGWNE